MSDTRLYTVERDWLEKRLKHHEAEANDLRLRLAFGDEPGAKMERLYQRQAALINALRPVVEGRAPDVDEIARAERAISADDFVEDRLPMPAALRAQPEGDTR